MREGRIHLKTQSDTDEITVESKDTHEKLGFCAFAKNGTLYLTSNKKIKRIKNIGKGTITVTLPKDMELEKAELDLKAGELRAEQILAKDLEVNAGAGEVNILEFAAEKAEFKCGVTKEKNRKEEIKIIGITGSSGKTTVANIIHEYLKRLGKKSVLYSSAKIDSPATIIRPDEACEITFNSEDDVLEIIEEVEAYGAEYLVLEVNETAIEKGLTKDIPFDVRVLTNFNALHNEDQYSKEEYKAIKKSFFEGMEKESLCIYGFEDYDKEFLEELLEANECKKYVYSSNYIATVKGVNKEDITSLLYELESTKAGLQMKVKVKNKTYALKTEMMMNYNALNIVGALTVLEAMGIFDINEYNTCIQKIKIPGRSEVYQRKGRMIVIDSHLPKVLESLQKLKDKKEINQIKVVIGSMGYGYQNWEPRFKTTDFIASRKKARKYAMELLKEKVDDVYLTESDNGKEKVLDICLELKGYLEDKVSSKIIEDREQAIREAIVDSKEGDVIFISGRGNRRVLCNSETTMKLIKDSEVVEKVLKELGW